MTSMTSFWCFTPFFSVSVVDFEQVNVNWVIPITSLRIKRSILKISENSKLTSVMEYILRKTGSPKSYLKWTPPWMLFCGFSVICNKDICLALVWVGFLGVRFAVCVGVGIKKICSSSKNQYFLAKIVPLLKSVV